MSTSIRSKGMKDKGKQIAYNILTYYSNTECSNRLFKKIIGYFGQLNTYLQYYFNF